MIGHEFACTETNYHHWIPLCSCGWQGPISPWRTIVNARTKRERRNLDPTRDALRRVWEAHVDAKSESIAKRSAAVIDANAAAVDKVIPIVLRPGRFPTT